ncbi:DUF4321 domain-containing protein [Paenibacillus sacheonensis]|uniref:DUF4321 domain-containing protein n=1 Tax=Paenibacillus sacheonensis TaxID=742054 RepID=A0A7X4YK38_9BACL|nr:DUF4321 domain-containing protein [Paenibacillus sacheonensis]MBM7563780.1 putative membrane protein [Paenibacillus sacheonensis]NBC67868.1 DUF4321 domain-containing protein [Paenibacillus sacheonensis]
MKKNFWVLLLFMLIGLLAGALIARSLSTVPGLSFLTNSTTIVWSPTADLLVLSYAITLRIHLSLLSIAGLALAIWLYRKL